METNTHTGSVTVTELRVSALAVLAYFLLARGWSLAFGVFHWTVIVVALFTVVWVAALAAIHRHRTSSTLTDRVMLYLPFAIWLFSSHVTGEIVWHFARGVPFWLSYGQDKGLANMLFEPAVVGCAAAPYFGHWWLGANGFTARRPFLILSVAVAVMAPLVVPPVGD